MSAVLLDTGPLVATLDRRHPQHDWVMQRFASVTGGVLTTGAVISEATVLFARISGAAFNIWSD